MKRGREEGGEVDMANCLMLLTKVGESQISPLKGREVNDGGAFKCKTCNRRFTSFQALGGHRASHKKPKLMVSDLSCHQLPNSNMKPRMHPCPICGLEFSIGQALGGHMRKHRVAIDDGMMNIRKHALPILKKSKDDNDKRLNLCLDLNLTPLENDLKLDLRMPVLDCLI